MPQELASGFSRFGQSDADILGAQTGFARFIEPKIPSLDA
jgi:hypothetical protein